MRITFVIASLSSGGAERVVSLMANYWVNTNKSVTIITLADKNDDFYFIDERVKRVSIGLAHESNNLFLKIFNNILRIVKLRKEITINKPDVVISFIDTMNVLTLISLLGTNIPVIVSERTDPMMHSIGRIWSLLRKLSYRKAKAIVVQTTKINSWINNNLKLKNSYIIPNPIQRPIVSESAIDERPFPNYVVAMGRLSKEKGFNYLIQAFTKCYQVLNNNDWGLVIIGDGKERQSLQQLINQLNMSEHIKLIGRIKEPTRIIKNADIFVLSSLYEGFPNALVEAMACGLPVICTKYPSGPEEIITNGVDGIIVQPGEIELLATEIIKLINDKTLRKHLGSNAAKIIERYDIEKVMMLWDTLILEVIKE